MPAPASDSAPLPAAPPSPSPAVPPPPASKLPPEVPAPAKPLDTESQSAFAPLKRPVFRLLWSTWLIANLCMWMNDVAAAWLMTSLTTSALWVALVQTAATLPVFLLGIPSGALADILDRRRYFLFTQLWVAAVALLLCGAVLSGRMTPALLLVLIFFNGIGLAMRWPVFAAITPELVPRAQLPAALALNGVSMNVSRIVGPIVAGALIASAGTQWVFVLNAVLSIVSAFIVFTWRRPRVSSPLGREPLLSAMRVGMQFVAQSARLRATFWRIGCFFFHSTALMALLPLLARGMDGGAATFTVLLASMGAGAIFMVLFMPRLRQRLTRDNVVLIGAAVQSAMTVVVAMTEHRMLAAPAMFVAGMAWIATANSLAVSAQMALPDWVRARGMSMYQMALMGSSAAGAAVWGQTAQYTTLQLSLLISAGSGVVMMLLVQRLAQDRSVLEDLTPSSIGKVPEILEPVGNGHVVVTIEYLIDPERSHDFRRLMRVSRRSRLRQGALSWDLLHDLNMPGRYVEYIVDQSWTEHLRRFDRVTADDVAVRERKLGFHIAEEPPVVTRYVVEPRQVR